MQLLWERSCPGENTKHHSSYNWVSPLLARFAQKISFKRANILAGTVHCNYVIILFAVITFTTNSAFFSHAPWLDQTCVHCPKFLTAAVRKRLGRVSVPVWLVILSEQLGIDGLVEPLPYQLPNPTKAHPGGVLCL